MNSELNFYESLYFNYDSDGSVRIYKFAFSIFSFGDSTSGSLQAVVSKMMERVRWKRKKGGGRVGSSVVELLTDQENPETADIVTYILQCKVQWKAENFLPALTHC